MQGSRLQDNGPSLLCDIVRSEKILPQEEGNVSQDAAATYKSKCAMCHGPDGKGGKMGTRDFASPEVKAESDAQLADIISKGKGKMPPYGAKLKDTEIKDLIAYIRTLAK